MSSMKIAKGIKGIKKFLADNGKGWHVTINNQYEGYFDETVLQVRTNFHGYTLVGWTGNGLVFVDAERFAPDADGVWVEKTN